MRDLVCVDDTISYPPMAHRPASTPLPSQIGVVLLAVSTGWFLTSSCVPPTAVMKGDAAGKAGCILALSRHTLSVRPGCGKRRRPQSPRVSVTGARCPTTSRAHGTHGAPRHTRNGQRATGNDACVCKVVLCHDVCACRGSRCRRSTPSS